jgi:nitric oxide dioxygenase
MTPSQITLIRHQFGIIARRSDAFSAQFYDRLFLLDPTLRPLFPADLGAQRGKLVRALAQVILSLHDLDAVIGDVRALGLRHTGYGVTAAHYDTVGLALLETLADMLGDMFDDASRTAWALAYGTIADAMIEAAAEPYARVAAE